MITKEALNRRIDKVIEYVSSGNATEAHSQARQLFKELDSYIDEKIRRAMESARTQRS